MRRPKRLPVILTDAEIEALRQRLPAKSTLGLRNRCIVETLLGAGLRVSELCNLKGSDVDLALGEIRVNLGKGRRDRVVPVDNETLAWLRAWAERRERLGLNGRAPFFAAISRDALGRPLTPWQVQRMLARAAKRAGIEKRCSPHVLRHSAASRWLRRGFTLAEVRDLLGHSDVRTTSIYLHADPQALREKMRDQKPPDPTVQRLAEALAALPEQARQALLEALQGR